MLCLLHNKSHKFGNLGSRKIEICIELCMIEAIIWKKKMMRTSSYYTETSVNWSTEFSRVKYKYLDSSEDHSTEKWIVPQNWISFAKTEIFIISNSLWGRITVQLIIFTAYYFEDEKEKVGYHWTAQ